MSETMVVVIAGPTASGKSALAIELARQLNGEIVNADSVQLYRGFDIGSATPDHEEQGGVPHHLLNVLDSDVVFSASDFAELADKAIADIVARGSVPIVVGGSGLYLRALLQGLSDSPPADASVRAGLYDEAAEHGLDALYDELAEVDPEYAAKIHENDRVRVVRALEVYRLSGRPISEHHREHQGGSLRYRVAGIGLSCPRNMLHRRIEKRAGRMLRGGLLAEVDGLLRAGASADCQPMNAIGYREVLMFRDGELEPDALEELIARNTRRFAKRQLVWFRKEPWLRWFDIREMPEFTPALVAAIGEMLRDPSLRLEIGETDERALFD